MTKTLNFNDKNDGESLKIPFAKYIVGKNFINNKLTLIPFPGLLHGSRECLNFGAVYFSFSFSFSSGEASHQIKSIIRGLKSSGEPIRVLY